MARLNYKQKVCFSRRPVTDVYTVTKLVGLVVIEGRREANNVVPAARIGHNWTEKQVSNFIEDNSNITVEISQ